jgi:hypothetical protein
MKKQPMKKFAASDLAVAGVLCFVAVLAASCVSPAQAQTIGLHIGSWHDARGFNDSNPGLYYQAESGLTLGVLRNSEARNSAYAGYTAQWPVGGRQADVSVTAGVIAGYRVGTMPMVIPSVGLALTDTVKARVALIPKVHKRGANAVHLMLEKRL